MEKRIKKQRRIDLLEQWRLLEAAAEICFQVKGGMGESQKSH